MPPQCEKPAGTRPTAPVAAVAGQPTVTVSRTRAASEPASAAKAPDDDDLNKKVRKQVVTLAAIDVATGKTRSLIPYDAEPPPYFVRLSPDGRWLSYLSVPEVKDAATNDFYDDLVILPSAGGKPVATFHDLRLQEDEDADATYRWTPDSPRIVSATDDALWIAEVGGAAQPRRLAATLGKIASRPFYLTPDGGSAVVSLVSADAQIYSSLGEPQRLAVVPLDAGEPHVLALSGTPIPADANTVWQPAADSIVVIPHIATSAQREIVEV